MWRSTKGLCLIAVILVTGCLAAGCGSTVSSAINNLPSRTATATPVPSLTRTATPDATDTTTPAVTSTATATVTATATETATPTTSPSAATSSGAGNLLWLWILLGAAALTNHAIRPASAGRRRSANAADWRSRLIDAYAKGSALHDAMSVAEAPGELASPNAAARWADIQRRADDLTQTLYSLREAVPDDADSARVGDTLTSLQAVRSAMAAERAAGGFDPRQAEVVRDRLYSFEMSLRALRQGDEYR